MLTRKRNESFVLELGGELVKIMVTRVGVNSATGKREVQIGIDAPGKCKVWRTELFEAMEENRRAAEAENKPELLRELFIRSRAS